MNMMNLHLEGKEKEVTRVVAVNIKEEIISPNRKGRKGRKSIGKSIRKSYSFDSGKAGTGTGGIGGIGVGRTVGAGSGSSSSSGNTTGGTLLKRSSSFGSDVINLLSISANASHNNNKKKSSKSKTTIRRRKSTGAAVAGEFASLLINQSSSTTPTPKPSSKTTKTKTISNTKPKRREKKKSSRADYSWWDLSAKNQFSDRSLNPELLKRSEFINKVSSVDELLLYDQGIKEEEEEDEEEEEEKEGQSITIIDNDNHATTRNPLIVDDNCLVNIGGRSVESFRIAKSAAVNNNHTNNNNNNKNNNTYNNNEIGFLSPSLSSSSKNDCNQVNWIEIPWQNNPTQVIINLTDENGRNHQSSAVLGIIDVDSDDKSINNVQDEPKQKVLTRRRSMESSHNDIVAKTSNKMMKRRSSLDMALLRGRTTTGVVHSDDCAGNNNNNNSSSSSRSSKDSKKDDTSNNKERNTIRRRRRSMNRGRIHSGVSSSNSCSPKPPSPRSVTAVKKKKKKKKKKDEGSKGHLPRRRSLLNSTNSLPSEPTCSLPSASSPHETNNYKWDEETKSRGFTRTKGMSGTSSFGDIESFLKLVNDQSHDNKSPMDNNNKSTSSVATMSTATVSTSGSSMSRRLSNNTIGNDSITDTTSNQKKEKNRQTVKDLHAEEISFMLKNYRIAF